MKIEELIDRYFEGQTSCEEERELRSFFTQENVPESLQVYRPLFFLVRFAGKFLSLSFALSTGYFGWLPDYSL